MSVLEIQVRAWRQQLLARTQDAATPAFAPMLGQLDQYWPKLFAPPLIVDTPAGPRTIQPQRTNNLMERFFRDLKRGRRRKTGQNALGRTLRTMLAQMRHAAQHTEKIPPQLKRFIANLPSPAPIKNLLEKLKSNRIS